MNIWAFYAITMPDDMNNSVFLIHEHLVSSRIIIIIIIGGFIQVFFKIIIKLREISITALKEIYLKYINN
jgi:hypothetical protein